MFVFKCLKFIEHTLLSALNISCEKVLLFVTKLFGMHNQEDHKLLKHPLVRWELVPPPHDKSSPMDLSGITGFLKKNYRVALLKALFNMYESIAQLPPEQWEKHLSHGSMGNLGLQYGKPPTLFEAISMLAEIWKNQLDTKGIYTYRYGHD